MKRREFLAACAATGAFRTHAHASPPFRVKFRHELPYARLFAFTEPGSDEFRGEKLAAEVERSLGDAVRLNKTPVAPSCTGRSPAPVRFEPIGPGVSKAVFGADTDVVSGWIKWRASLGNIRAARFYAVPGDVVRYDIRGENSGRLEHRVGHWRQSWSDGAIVRLEPLDETVTYGDKPWFQEITSHAFAEEPSFREQLMRGVPYWRARLDPACGIDVYGENGIAAADVDGDGEDEIYVCQPGGLPNRLYKRDAAGRFRDISHEAGLDILDDTASALFVDLRNAGCQDLVLVRSTEPVLFLNDGRGRFTPAPDAFRFRTRPQGSFTSVAAADYDRDGRLDLYFCCYVYYQSEQQYRYPTPYHDAQNGPPNFLFRNRMDQSPGYFEDVTAETGMEHNNNRFSFAATWCDYNGDGWPDLYVTNDFGRKNLYRNTNGKFRDVAQEAGVVDLGPGMSAAWLDYDGDGRPDLLVSNMWSSCGQRVVNDPEFGPAKADSSLRQAYRSHVKGNSLYHNNGDGTFTYTGDSQGIEICPWSWSCGGADFDNDGSPEIHVACGMVTNNSNTDLMSYFYRQVVSKSPPRYMVAPEYENGWDAINQLIRQDFSWAGPEPNVFLARRAGRYYDFSGVSGVDKAEDSRAFAITDLDGDGNLDLVLKSRLGPQVRIFQNDCAMGRRSIAFSLRGTKSNRDAIGACVEVDGQKQWLTAGSGYLSQHTKRLYFGLRDRSRAERVRIVWPSGREQNIGPLEGGFLYSITEGDAQFASKRFSRPANVPSQPPLAEADNRARLHTGWLWEPVPLIEKSRGPALFVLHAGEPPPRLPVPVQAVDLRQSSPDSVASWAIFRRYLFDYRVGLETPLWLLIDGESRVRKIYASAPDAATARADLDAVNGPLPDARALPFGGVYIGNPRRDYFKVGGALLAAGYNEQALPYLEEMLRRTPDNPKALFAVGRIHLQANRIPQAREVLERAIAVAPKSGRAWNELGGVEEAAGNPAAALKCYEQALAAEPDFVYAMLNAAQVYAKRDNTREAERLYRRVMEIEPRNADAANSLGLLYAKSGRTEEARKLFELAISVQRDDPNPINNLGVLYMNLGQLNDAVAAFQYGIGVAPDNETLYMNLARVWVAAGNQEKAREVVHQLLEHKPDSEIGRRALKALETP